ncbi:MAG TPA: hypothetical protein VF665_17550 [Longimicrobium sp.]|jgi:hypothetical protein|uniref:hypothetical protein n=1 Tax=Longimicrobium sp. TaxID=2029185 RepID=UPI002EDAAB00
MPSDVDLVRLLNSVGKEVFVTYFDTFAAPTLSNEQVAARLPADFTGKSRRSRTSHARRIFREGLAADALEIISKSSRLDPKVIECARMYRTRLAMAR